MIMALQQHLQADDTSSIGVVKAHDVVENVRIKKNKRGFTKENQVVISGCPPKILVVRKLPQYAIQLYLRLMKRSEC